ncbi:hypothetical protein [Micromonospora sp. AKA38]|uniref:hypothetical protein n=1 Tax=Micromonospora sp. AKA38 TaxID=2733861 RepID=UPI002490C814|nr:hypothetical protein [Micromonospora sp. AKA38]
MAVAAGPDPGIPPLLGAQGVGAEGDRRWAADPDVEPDSLDAAGPARLTGFIDRPNLVGTAQLVDLDPGPGYLGRSQCCRPGPARVREPDDAEVFATTGFVR